MYFGIQIIPVDGAGRHLMIPPDERGDILLALRNIYLSRSEDVTRERSEDTDEKTRQKLNKHLRRLKLQQNHLFSSDNLFDADESMLVKVAELRQVLNMGDRFFNFNLFARKWVDCKPLIKSDLIRYILADRLLREAIYVKAHIRIISFLIIICGADPNSLNHFLYTPLHIAAITNRVDAARVLLVCGADRNIYGALGLSSRGRMKRPEDIISNMTSSILNWSATLVLLRGECCASCTSYFTGSDYGHVTCSHCFLSLCTDCAGYHHCIYHRIVPRADDHVTTSTPNEKKVSGEKAGEIFDGGENHTVDNSELSDIKISNEPQPWQNVMLPVLFGLLQVDSVALNFGAVEEIRPPGTDAHVEPRCPTFLFRYLYFSEEIRLYLKMLLREATASKMSVVITDSETVTTENRKLSLISHFLGRSWEIGETHELWVPDRVGWFCKVCSSRFSLFHRKHVSYIMILLVYSIVLYSYNHLSRVQLFPKSLALPTMWGSFL